MSKLGRIWRKEERRKVEYEARNVREILKEMKDISELIVDLSYSAILFNNEDLAEEVRYLEARMDTLNYEIRMQAMLAARDAEDAEKLAGILQVAEAAETISNAAADVTEITKLKLEHPLIPSLFKQSDELLVRIGIEPYACGKSVSELRIRSKTGCKVIAIRRGISWIFAPKNEPFVEGDVALVKGTEKGIEKLRALLRGEQ
ncbi:MAG: TrkA C-terminal domain-containing protein [Candidatus Thermoplasmatota archaeon]|nr:TrkA C-terminal domain-containing protein [Candidatus Thermoplasmatota archaeon]